MFRLRIAANTQQSSESIEDEGSSGDDQPLSEEERRKCLVQEPLEFPWLIIGTLVTERRREFERRRKAHYREFEAVKLARKLIQEEDDDDEGEESTDARSLDSRPSGSAQGASTSSGRFASSSAKKSNAQSQPSASPSTSATSHMDLEPSNN